MKKRLALTTLLLSAALPALAAGGAAPFGVEIGVAKCEAARKALGGTTDKDLGGGHVLLTATKPADVYPGAQEVVVRCAQDVVIALNVEAGKGGMGNPAPREVFANLKRKYKLVDGGAMPTVGNGYARFTAGNTVIEENAPHMSFQFTVTYYTRDFYESLVNKNKQEKEQIRKDKDKL